MTQSLNTTQNRDGAELSALKLNGWIKGVYDSTDKDREDIIYHLNQLIESDRKRHSRDESEYKSTSHKDCTKVIGIQQYK